MQPIKQMIEENPSFGYRMVAYQLNFNKNTVQRIFQLIHWADSQTPGWLPDSRARYALRCYCAKRARRPYQSLGMRTPLRLS